MPVLTRHWWRKEAYMVCFLCVFGKGVLDCQGYGVEGYGSIVARWLGIYVHGL